MSKGLEFKCSSKTRELLTALIRLGELQERILQKRAWDEAHRKKGVR